MPNRLAYINHSLLCTAAGLLDWIGDGCTMQYWAINTPGQIFLCDVSLSYFVLDFLLDVLNGVFDGMFAMHHIVSVTTLVTIRYIEGRGGAWMSKSYILGEMSNLIQIPWIASKALGYMHVHAALGTPFTYVFLLLRAGLFPISFVMYLRESYFDPAFVPLDHVAVMHANTFLFVLFLVGSGVWVTKALQGHLKKLRLLRLSKSKAQ